MVSTLSGIPMAPNMLLGINDTDLTSYMMAIMHLVSTPCDKTNIILMLLGESELMNVKASSPLVSKVNRKLYSLEKDGMLLKVNHGDSNTILWILR